ncbi:3-hydroxyisobutyrate dehydrogenase [Brevundimonas goettingensis]|jgi:3-hydroxyisobutyrate dehydrogenase|uniref:3-hydroxyisobutyrate dehydrogenase n=1 Tax=Brevundimonas goettingensis TaxID=2774190 RepID=A0A975GV63_9CAUL|nr:3-hydroxyisobutyrate dehydrogenase [Brevundimonas goettingensis]QTC90248.1 3-hydroxyisobutyrate dehydrogenase [Brevundimonas goettingensis]
MKIAFIGLGNMGGGMAANQAKAGHEVSAFDLSQAALDRAKGAGCTPVGSVVEAVRDADVVITVLPAGPQVLKVYSESIIGAAPTGALLIDCSTIDVDTARKVAGMATEAGYVFADAPMSGGTTGADAGTLAFMVGCPEDQFARVEAALEPMSRAAMRAGDHGAGQAAKICNNMILGATMIATCEAVALAEKLGLDPVKFYDIASKSSGQSWSVTTYYPWPGPVPTSPANRNYDGGFATAMMLKDLKLAQDAAAKAGASTPLGAQAEALFQMFDGLGYGGRDFSAILQMLRGQLDGLPKA